MKHDPSDKDPPARQRTAHRDPADHTPPIPPRGQGAHSEALVDEAVAETLPASDPISPYSHASSRPVASPSAQRAPGPPVEQAPPWSSWTRNDATLASDDAADAASTAQSDAAAAQTVADAAAEDEAPTAATRERAADQPSSRARPAEPRTEHRADADRRTGTPGTRPSRKRKSPPA